MTKPLLPRCIILGGGGHARVLIDSLMAMGTVTLVGILEANRQIWGTEMMGIPILGGDELLSRNNKLADCFVVGLGGIGDNQPRRRLFETGVKNGLKPLEVIHPQAVVSHWAQIGAGCQILPGAVVNAGATLGANVIVNSGAIVEHDCKVGDHVHIATGAKLCSTVIIDEAAHIGAGATVRQCIRIGKDSVVGAGAVVVRDVEQGTTVVGIPARPKK